MRLTFSVIGFALGLGACFVVASLVAPPFAEFDNAPMAPSFKPVAADTFEATPCL